MSHRQADDRVIIITLGTSSSSSSSGCIERERERLQIVDDLHLPPSPLSCGKLTMHLLFLSTIPILSHTQMTTHSIDCLHLFLTCAMKIDRQFIFALFNLPRSRCVHQRHVTIDLWVAPINLVYFPPDNDQHWNHNKEF